VKHNIRYDDETRAEIRRLARCLFTYQEIGDRLGTTAAGIASAIKRYRILTTEETREIKSRRMTGNRISKAQRKLLSERQRRLWSNPEYRARAIAKMTAASTTPEAMRRRRQVAAKRRGFAVPEHLRDDYNFLRRDMWIPAREAARMLGILPAPVSLSAGVRVLEVAA